jgi:putative membrane protein
MGGASLFVNYALYLVSGLLLWGVSLVIYTWVTPMRELELVRAGNFAAALSLSGAALGLMLPLGSLAIHAVNLADMALWAVVSLAVQVIFYVAAGSWSRAVALMIADDNRAVGLLAGTLAVCLGAISACCLSY